MIDVTFHKTRKTARALGTAVALSLTVALAACSPASQPPNPAPPPSVGNGGGAPTETVRNFVYVDMVSPASGWALTDKSVLKTADGGAAWQDVTPPGLKNTGVIDPGYPGGSAFLDDAHAWLASAAEPGAPIEVYRTADGGKSWARWAGEEVADGARTQFIDAKHGWLLLYQGVGAGNQDVTLLRSDDGGATWSAVATTRGDTGTKRLPRGGLKSGFTFRDETHGWLTGYAPVDNAAYLYATADGGRTWQQQRIPLPPDLQPDQLSTEPPVFFGQVGILPVRFSGHQKVVFYRTEDGGLNWQPTRPLVLMPEESRLIWSFADERHGFAVSEGRLRATADGGQTWDAVPAEIGPRSLAQIDFPSPQVGLAITSRSQLLKTGDGGRTWVAVQ